MPLAAKTRNHAFAEITTKICAEAVPGGFIEVGPETLSFNETGYPCDRLGVVAEVLDFADFAQIFELPVRRHSLVTCRGRSRENQPHFAASAIAGAGPHPDDTHRPKGLQRLIREWSGICYQTWPVLLHWRTDTPGFGSTPRIRVCPERLAPRRPARCRCPKPRGVPVGIGKEAALLLGPGEEVESSAMVHAQTAIAGHPLLFVNQRDRTAALKANRRIAGRTCEATLFCGGATATCC